MVPDQVISLMEMGGPTFAMGDHADHVHVGYAPGYGPVDRLDRGGPSSTQVLKPEQWRAADRPARRDRQPDGADLALRRRPAGEAEAEGQGQARLARAPRRVARAPALAGDAWEVMTVRARFESGLRACPPWLARARLVRGTCALSLKAASFRT